MTAEAFEIAGQSVEPGSRRRVELPISRRVTGAEMALPLEIVHGREAGPTLFVSAAVHGDEINGVEIIRRVLRQRFLRNLRGTLIAIPVVNLFGFVGLSRYLPDRRDLNRSFPGSATGSLAGRLANLFLTQIVEKSTHGIDLHTAAVHRSNLPQIRACLDDPETDRLARAFGVPVIIDAALRDGSLRAAVADRGIPMLIYEGGEALRFDEQAIRAGVRGVLSVMSALEMVTRRQEQRKSREPFVARSSHWVRAPEGGILRARANLGALVEEGEKLGVVADPLGHEERPVLSQHPGIVIGRSELPLANEGDALFHVATFKRPEKVSALVENFQDDLDMPATSGLLEPSET